MDAAASSSTPEPVTSTLELPGGRGERVVWRYGVGRPLLLIQGMGGTHDHWGDVLLARLMAAGRSVICVNHRGVYGTERPEAGYGTGDLADDQAAALDALGADGPIDVFGISMGGMTALELALRHRDRIRTLALGCTTAGGSLMTYPAQEDIEHLFAEQQSGDRERALRAAFEINFSEAVWGDADAFARFSELTSRAPLPVPVIMGQFQAVATHDVADRLGELAELPVAVMHGTADRLLPYANGVAVHERIPGATLDTFEGAGHLYFWEHGERTAEVLEALSARADAEVPHLTTL